MSITKHLAGIMLLITCIPMLQVYAQPVNLVLQDTTIATTAIFAARNSITAGPNFTIAGTGDVTVTLIAPEVALKPRFFIIKGGELQVVSEVIAVNIKTEDPVKPDEFIVHQNFPNPFNPETEIRFALTKDSHVVINVYNTLGQHIDTLIDTQYPAGFHSVRWDGNDTYGSPVSSGVYLYKVQAGEFSQVRKMSLIR